MRGGEEQDKCGIKKPRDTAKEGKAYYWGGGGSGRDPDGRKYR